MLTFKMLRMAFNTLPYFLSHTGYNISLQFHTEDYAFVILKTKSRSMLHSKQTEQTHPAVMFFLHMLVLAALKQEVVISNPSV